MDFKATGSGFFLDPGVKKAGYPAKKAGYPANVSRRGGNLRPRPRCRQRRHVAERGARFRRARRQQRWRPPRRRQQLMRRRLPYLRRWQRQQQRRRQRRQQAARRAWGGGGVSRNDLSSDSLRVGLMSAPRASLRGRTLGASRAAVVSPLSRAGDPTRDVQGLLAAGAPLAAGALFDRLVVLFSSTVNVELDREARYNLLHLLLFRPLT